MALTKAYSGAPPGDIPLSNVFDFHFGQPFERESAFTPTAHRVPKVKDDHKIFIDNKTERALTYSRISSDALAFAASLLSLGLDPESDIHKLPPTPSCPAGPEIAPVVLIQLPNCLPFAPILLGVFAAGCTATLASPALTADEIAWILQNARPKVIITSVTNVKAMRAALAKPDVDQAWAKTVPVYTVDVAAETYPGPAEFFGVPKRDWRKLLEYGKTLSPVKPAELMPGEKAAARTAVILWSSGTSGRSKGVLLSHHALNFATASLWHDADYYRGQQQSWLGYVPFYHVFGLCNVFLLGVAAGARVYVMQAFNLKAMLDGIRERKVTYLHMAPPVAVMLAKAPVVEEYAKRDGKTGKNGFSTVVGAVTGGAPLGHEVVVQVYRRCGFRVRLGYGLSETCSTALQRGLGEREMMEQAGDTGRPHYGVEVLIADPEGTGYATRPGETTKPAGIDVEGEVLVRAPGLLSAYLPVGVFSGKKPDMSVTNEALTADGWFRTGDVGALCEEGRLRITDRLKELIKVRAYQVAPAELEAVLCSSEAVADAGVVGVYDKDEATEWPRAFVVPAGGGKVVDKTREELEKLANELRVLVEKRTAKYKWLVGGIVFIDQVPKSPSGKILRRLLKSGAEGPKGVEVLVYAKKKRPVVAAKL
ncbi:putative acyl-CoA synthetase /AMP-acid ligase II [Podospora australis]|uniref:Acyl-CoA synthetase /AMP-acid ligase II n=1 Tax=Podospora australis TaxID=1536484 RepID=A0AAN7AFZ0_9PEZI|nr:putative acyl-CoA synthetase /AMP-acid ligase II [Podospora australis]